MLVVFARAADEKAISELDQKLLTSAIASDTNKVVEALSEGAHINVSDAGANTPLHWAAMNGDLEMVRLLVEKSADINARASGCWGTALSMASGNGHLEVVKYLVDKKADINLKGIERGETPFQEACMNGYLEIVKFLLSKKPDVTAKNKTGFTAFELAQSNNKKEVVDYLRKQGVRK